MSDLLWPQYDSPADLAAIEAVPLADRGLPESTYALLVRAAARWPERSALSVLPEATRWVEAGSRTFVELLADVHRFANLLHRLGIRRGDAVALIAPNCAELIPATLAAQLAGIAAPVNGALSREHLAELLRRSGARVLITAGPELDAGTWDTVRDPGVEPAAILVLRPTGATSPATPLPAVDGVLIGYLDELAAAEDTTAFAGESPRSGDLAAVFHTGGTTGAPKLAAHTHGNEVADAWMLAANSLFDSDSVLFAALPLFHVNALVVTLLAPLFKGQHVVWAGPLGYRDPALYGEFWRIVEHYRIASMSAVPTVYAVLAQVPVNADIGSLRFAMVGASPLPAAVRAGFEDHTGVPLLEGYGLTEATCASARSFPDTPRPGAVGQRLPYQRMKVEDGVLRIGGPTVFPGYVTGRDDHGLVLDGLGKLAGGWLDTGDFAEVDEDGFVFLRGRAKDLIIRGGHNIDPALVEDALLAHPQVTSAGAVGRPDPHAGEVPVAYVTPAPGTVVTEEELLAWAADRAPERAAVPKAVTVLEARPVTVLGKPDKLALRADATHRAVAAALAGIPGARVAVRVEDGSVVATVTLAAAEDEAAVEAALGAYAVRWELRILEDVS
ncbi:acyl-CoA synthetase [Amycolatopsis mediterranei]|uniref:acyl-CoA synthetase n=1 Tax=Amycolatopsis mediterranei TaxID=33910 RepID=UPI003412B7E3